MSDEEAVMEGKEMPADEGPPADEDEDEDDVQSARIEGADEVDTMTLEGTAEVRMPPASSGSLKQPFDSERTRGARSMTLARDSGAEVLDENGTPAPEAVPEELRDNVYGTLKIADDGNMTLEAYDRPASETETAEGTPSQLRVQAMMRAEAPPQATPSSLRPRGMSIERSPEMEVNMRQHLPPGPTISPDQQKLLDELGMQAGPTGFSKTKEVHMLASDVMMETMEAKLGISWRRDMDREEAIDEARAQYYEHFAGQAIFKEVGLNEPAYDPADYEHLTVPPEIAQMFQFITSYTPQTIDLEHRLKPFIPDFIPAIGDIDAFIKVERPDGKADSIGLSVLDEPRAQQSDKNVLDLQLRAVAKTTTHKQTTVASVPNADRNHKAVEKWIKDIGDLHRSKPAPSVHYNKPMPDIDYLMQEWPAEFEEVLSSTHLPTADLDCDLATYVDIICSIMDIPVYKSKVQSLHVLFTLYSAFKQSGHFGQQPEANPNYQQMTL
ncbi:intraflagellar transport protein 46 homolog isoform X2 [Amphibalanus amphitrite]|uniref:intraflagellar transport protein 46 homolog isoform X2 n=1 Tax=Amphibalanus amphitrite TaxID=1232801 RepID=UPI001C9044EF|nr:intraflagellar transport protein 46 homolog isoform X2 [Amphibalanus amphitrite]